MMRGRGSSRRALSAVIVLALLHGGTALAGSVSAVKTRLMQAQEYIDHNRNDDAKDVLDQAEKFLDGLSDAERKPLEKQIADLRAKLPGAKPKPAESKTASGGPAGNAPVAPGIDPEESGRIERNITRYLTHGEEELSGNAGNAASYLAGARRALDDESAKTKLDPAVRKKLEARADELEKKMNAAAMGEESKRYADKVDSSLRAAADNIKNDPRFVQTRIDEVSGWLASDEAKQKLDAATMTRLQGSLADVVKQLAAADKADALSRAEPEVKTLEGMLTADPFKGKDEYGAYKASEELKTPMVRASYQLSRLPADDADRKALEARLAAASKKIDAFSDTWSNANVESGVVNSWKLTSGSLGEWQNESWAPDPQRPFAQPKLEKTQGVIDPTKYFLEAKHVVAAKPQAAKLPKAAEAIAEAEKTLAEAQAKLDAAFNAWMDASEKLPRPQGALRFDIGSAHDMANWAERYLGGTKYLAPDVARANKLDKKWQDEIAAVERQYKEALEKLTAKANADWPKIAAGIPCEKGEFNPADVASAKGKTYSYHGVRNRTGWDFDGQYGFAMWLHGTPVAGDTVPEVDKAFNEAAKQIGSSIDDHKDWEVIFTVLGTGTINQRYTSEVKDEHMNVIAKIEGYRPRECVLVRVIAVHAGPVAASGK